MIERLIKSIASWPCFWDSGRDEIVEVAIQGLESWVS